MKLWCLKCLVCKDSPDKQSMFDGPWKIFICLFISFLSLQLNEFLQSVIKQELSSTKKITCIIAIADKKILLYSAYLGSCAPHLSLLFKLNSFFSLALFPPGISQLVHDVVTTLGYSCILVATSDNVVTTLTQRCVSDVVTTIKN